MVLIRQRKQRNEANWFKFNLTNLKFETNK